MAMMMQMQAMLQTMMASQQPSDQEANKQQQGADGTSNTEQVPNTTIEATAELSELSADGSAQDPSTTNIDAVKSGETPAEPSQVADNAGPSAEETAVTTSETASDNVVADEANAEDKSDDTGINQIQGPDKKPNSIVENSEGQETVSDTAQVAEKADAKTCDKNDSDMAESEDEKEAEKPKSRPVNPDVNLSLDELIAKSKGKTNTQPASTGQNPMEIMQKMMMMMSGQIPMVRYLFYCSLLLDC